MSPNQIRCHLNFRVLSEHGEDTATGTFTYHRDDPYAITTELVCRGYTETWVFSRDLLSAGLTGHVGLGDVRVWPNTQKGIIHIQLNTPDGCAYLFVDAGPLTRFLGRTYWLVPIGTETRHLDLDGLCDELLRGVT